MAKILVVLPIYASAKFYIEKPDNWDKMSKSEKADYFSENMETNAQLCHQCSNDLESSYDLDDNYYNGLTDGELEDMFWEES